MVREFAESRLQNACTRLPAAADTQCLQQQRRGICLASRLCQEALRASIANKGAKQDNHSAHDCTMQCNSAGRSQENSGNTLDSTSTPTLHSGEKRTRMRAKQERPHRTHKRAPSKTNRTERTSTQDDDAAGTSGTRKASERTQPGKNKQAHVQTGRGIST